MGIRRAIGCVNRTGIGHAKIVIIFSNMHRWLFKLFDQTVGAMPLFMNVITGRLLVMLLMAFAVVPVNVAAQSSASSTSQAFQSSKTPGALSSHRSGEGFLGVYLGDINEERARELKLNEVRGAVVGKVEDASPAAAAGLQENDVILAFNNQKVYNPSQLYRYLTESTPGEIATLGISRGGATQNVSVKLGKRLAAQMDETQRLFAAANAMLASAEESAKLAEEARQRGDEKEAARLLEEEKAFRRASEENRAAVEQELKEGKIQIASPRRLSNNLTAARYQLGIHVTELTDQLAKFFNTAGGVLVSEVIAGEAAERSGIKAGDCIVAVNGERVDAPSDLNRLVDRTGKDEKDGGEVTLSVVRDRNEQSIKVRFDRR